MFQLVFSLVIAQTSLSVISVCMALQFMVNLAKFLMMDINFFTTTTSATVNILIFWGSHVSISL